MRKLNLIIIALTIYSCGPLKDVYCPNLNETVRVPRNPDKYQKIYAKEKIKKFNVGDFEFAKGANAEISNKIVQLTEKFNQSNTSFELASSKLIYLTSIRPCAQENYASQLAKLSTEFVTLNNELEKIKVRKSISKEEVEKVIDKVEKETIKIDSISKELPKVEQVKKKIPNFRNNEKLGIKNDSSLARENELKGFQNILNKNLNNAIFFFVQSENFDNGFHQVYEISKYLKGKEKIDLKDNKFWLDIYSDVLIKFNKFIEPRTKKELSKYFLNSSDLKNIRIYNLGLNSDKTDKVFQKINSYYPNTTKKNLSKKPSWFAPKPSILWYDEKSIPLATALKFIIEDELDIKVIVKRGGGLGVDMSNKLNELRIHLRE